MELKKSNDVKTLIAIEYPGRVVNVDKMVETLGGIEDLSKAFQEKQKLQLRFRQNFFAKPAISTDSQEQTGMLVKVKTRRSKKHPEKKPEIVSAEIVGTVASGYKFNNPCDFQYLPIQFNEKTRKTENIYHDCVPEDINVGPSWFRDKPDAQIFLPPSSFVRSDIMQPTVLKNETNAGESEENIKFASTNRQSRTTNGIAIPFNLNEPVPSKPKDAVKDNYASNWITPGDVDAVKKVFSERPIWTLQSLRAHMQPPISRLNFILATIAFYYSTGPWRNCFVRFGYDPRRDFESRNYQLVDYRVRAGAGFKEELNSRSQIYASKRNKDPESIFTPDTIPPFRARHYQFVDIHVPKIQDMIEKIPTPLQSGVQCNEKRGWLPGGFMEECRNILSEIAESNMRKLCNEKNISFDDFSIKSATVERDEGSDSDETETQFPEDVDVNDDD